MCLILFAWQAHPRYRLVVGANRDEFHLRPAADARFWKDHPQLLAGQDLQGGGTWLGVTTTGRFSAITNYREPQRQATEEYPSRGALVHGFLTGDGSPTEFAEETERRSYAGFNLLIADQQEMRYLSNRSPQGRSITPGCHGLSNHLLDTPWPKVEEGTAELKALIRGEHLSTEALLEILSDRTTPPDHALPDTGIGQERERLLGSRFIRSPGYGTRSSTAMTINRNGEVQFMERTFDAMGDAVRNRFHEFQSIPDQ